MRACVLELTIAVTAVFLMAGCTDIVTGIEDQIADDIIDEHPAIETIARIARMMLRKGIQQKSRATMPSTMPATARPSVWPCAKSACRW
mgnify:CR=1 FL=1